MNDLKILSLLCATIALVLPAAALAGGRATFETADASNGTITITWRDSSTSRMRASGDPGYFIVRDGKAYSVFDAGGTPRVMDMGALARMMQGFGGRGQDNRPQNPFASVGAVKPTGATDTVAGIQGRVYQMQWTDADGKPQSGKALLTDDPRAVAMTQAYFGLMTAMFGTDVGASFQKDLPGNDRGLLRVGDDFRVTSITRDDPPASTFDLPAEPMDMQKMMRGMRRH